MRKHVKPWFAMLVAEFFYCGRIPFAPGTMGSLGSLVIWIPSVYFAWPLWLKLAILLTLFFLGLWAATYGINRYNNADPKQVVIDEVLGQGIPFLIIKSLGFEIILAVIFFRLFDILKPWPIRNIELQFSNHWGLMLDDVMAGIFALFLVFICKVLFFPGMLWMVPWP